MTFPGLVDQRLPLLKLLRCQAVTVLGLEGRTVAQLAHGIDKQQWHARFERMKAVPGSGFAIVEEIEDPSKKSGIKSVGKLKE